VWWGLNITKIHYMHIYENSIMKPIKIVKKKKRGRRIRKKKE
jgi:hypothetical protein